MKEHLYGLMVLKAPIHDGILVNPIMLGVKTVQNYTPVAIGMIDHVQIHYRVTSVALLVRFYFYFIRYNFRYPTDHHNSYFCLFPFYIIR